MRPRARCLDWFAAGGNTLQFGNRKLAFLEYIEQVVRQVEVAFVDFVDEESPRGAGRQQGGAECFQLQERSNVVDFFAKLLVMKATASYS